MLILTSNFMKFKEICTKLLQNSKTFAFYQKAKPCWLFEPKISKTIKLDH